MPKRALLKDKLAQEKTAPVPKLRAPRDTQAARNGGRGRLIGVHVAEPAYKQMRLLAVERDLKHNELLREALNDWFEKHKKPRIA